MDDISDIKAVVKANADRENKKAKAKKGNPTIDDKLDYIISMLESKGF